MLNIRSDIERLFDCGLLARGGDLAALPDCDFNDEDKVSRQLLAFVEQLHDELAATERFEQAISHLDRPFQRQRRLEPSLLLLATDTSRASLRVIHPERSIPLHDHPGAYGVQRVVVGEAEVSAYHRVAIPASSKDVTLLEQGPLVRLKQDQQTFFTPYSRNLHAIRAISPRCIMLNIECRRDTGVSEKSMFIPVETTAVSGGAGRYKKITRRHRSKHVTHG